jgi:hypothetical protein
MGAIKLGGLLARDKAVVKAIVPGAFDIARGTGGSGIASQLTDLMLASPRRRGRWLLCLG